MTITNIKTAITGWRNKHPVIVFVGSFALLMILFYIFYFNPWVEAHVFNPIVNVYATISGKLLNIFGYQTTVFGDTITSAQFSVGIKKGCDAMEPMALFVAGILAFPAPFKSKLWGLFTGLIILFLLNIVRIVSLFLTGVHKREWFEAMHLEVWQVIFIVIALGLWFLWLRWNMKKTSAA